METQLQTVGVSKDKTAKKTFEFIVNQLISRVEGGWILTAVAYTEDGNANFTWERTKAPTGVKFPTDN